MKKLVLFVASIFAMSSITAIANAQAAGPTGGGIKATGTQAGKGKAGGPIGAYILQQLNLTPDEKKQIRALTKTFREKRQQLVQAGPPPNKKEMVALRRQYIEDLGKVLTPAQRDKMKELIQARRNRAKTGQSGNGQTGAAAGKGGG